ncbi:HEAT repeat domain-containing protein [Streptomyces sp. NPDC059247]|uniref:HEAT repeat domain-containing protein n=1 Tax=Streptomyces sp. NPDC059247 TaxID=3346790 RepID=UPI003693212B
MWEGLDAVDWAGLRHNYGSAKDIPELLRRCAGPDRDDARAASSDLYNHLFHQGGWICSAASAALPFVLRLASVPEVWDRPHLLELVGRLASEAGLVRERERERERFLDPAWEPAWAAALPALLDLLDDPEPEVRRAAVDVLGGCGSPGASVLPGLLRRWAAEDDPAARLDLVLSLGPAVRREPVGRYGDETRALLRDLLDDPRPQTRLAAVHALAPDDPDLPGRRLGLVLEAVRDPSVELWRHAGSTRSGVRGVHHWTAGLMTGPDPAFALGLLADHPDDEQRIGALAQTGGLLARWRSPAAALLPRVVARLDDPATEARFRAAELLACLGPAGAAHADEVASLLGDTAVRPTRVGQTVHEAALWALARMNDPRCLPGLTELLGSGARSGFASASAFYPSGGPHHVVLPALHEVLVRLPDHAGPLLPPLVERLGAPTRASTSTSTSASPSADDRTVQRLCEVLAGWGSLAQPAVPRLVGLLADDRTWTAAAEALAGIGPAGGAAREPLLARSHGTGPDALLAAWAYWRVGGDPGPALEAFGREVLAGPVRHPSLRRLADLGPHAAPHADRFRTLTTDTDVWTRVEAAHALWAATGDAGTAAPVLTEAVRDLAEGTHRPVMLPALRHLTGLGRAARPAAHLLRDVPADDRRLGSSGTWRGFVQDEDVRIAVGELLTACG